MDPRASLSQLIRLKLTSPNTHCDDALLGRSCFSFIFSRAAISASSSSIILSMPLQAAAAERLYLHVCYCLTKKSSLVAHCSPSERSLHTVWLKPLWYLPLDFLLDFLLLLLLLFGYDLRRATRQTSSKISTQPPIPTARCLVNSGKYLFNLASHLLTCTTTTSSIFSLRGSRDLAHSRSPFLTTNSIISL